MTSLSVVVGNPKPNSRTRVIAELLGNHIASLIGAEIRPTLDLIAYGPELFDWPAENIDSEARAVAASDVVVFASPTYKASYSGLLKAFLDRYDTNGLSGVVAVPLLTIGSPHHSLAVETNLRPLLVELGASVPTKGLAFLTSEYENREEVVSQWLASQEQIILRAAGRIRES